MTPASGIFPTPSSKSSTIIALAAVIAMLYFGHPIFIPLALALVLSFLLTPLASFLEKLHLGRVLSVFIVMIICLAATVTVGWKVAGQLLEITGHVGDYRSNIEQKVHSLRSHHSAPLVEATATVQELNKELGTAPAMTNAAAARKMNAQSTRPIPVQVTPPANFVQDLRSVLGPLTGPAEIMGLVVIFTAFMLLNREDLRNRLVRLGGEGRLNVVTQALQDASAGLSRYLLLQFAVNACYGGLFGLGLFIIGVPHAFLWGALEGTLRFVPYIGVWVATAFPMAMATAVFPGWKQVLLTFTLFAVLEVITANFVEPFVYGKHIGISPFAILVAAVFWASLWGPVGLILSTPLTLCLVLIGRYVPAMSFLEILLGDAPVLPPHELYCQRLLAMDQEEAGNIAEDYLRDKGRESLYESVLIPALKLAEEKRHSDILGDRAAAFIWQTTRELIDDLSERTLNQTDSGLLPRPPARSNQPIVCLPANDDADELVGMMLAQLLREAGYTAVRALSVSTPEHLLDQIEAAPQPIAFISAMPPFAVGQTRTLCRRMLARDPHIRVMVGLWGFAGGVARAQQRIGPFCTDAVCTTLADALRLIQNAGDVSRAA